MSFLVLRLCQNKCHNLQIMKRTKQLLSVDELIASASSINEIDAKILNHGPKFKFPLGTSDEAATIKSYQDDFRRLISMERIARRSDRSTAHIENGLVKIVRRVGKWKLFGSSNHLKWHEAMYLIEVNRLNVYFDSVIVSLERAYNLFLRKSTDSVACGKLSKEEYAVYSHFMRSGYTIQEHKPEDDSTNSNTSSRTDQTDTRSQTEQCIWNYLFELLGQQQHATKRSNIDSEIYEKVKSSMNNTISGIKTQNTKQNTVSQKRKHEDDDEMTSTTNQYFGTESLNAFMLGDGQNKFRKVFDKIDIIQLNAKDPEESDSSEMLNFSFDLWTDGVYKKTENSEPNYRIVVQRGNRKDLPNIRCIKNLFQRQVYKCPIILIYVSDEFAFHPYIYRFTT